MLSECDRTSKKEAQQLIKKYKEQSKDRNLGAEVKKVVDPEMQNVTKKNSTMLNAMFAYCVRCIICTDIGSDINLMPPNLFHAIRKECNDASDVI